MTMAEGKQALRPDEVFRAFLKLGLISFGGPLARIGYLREEFVIRPHWLDDASCSDLVATIYNPVWIEGVKNTHDAAAAVVAFGLLQW